MAETALMQLWAIQNLVLAGLFRLQRAPSRLAVADATLHVFVTINDE